MPPDTPIIFFTVIESVLFQPSMYGIKFGQDIFLVHFTDQDISDPNNEIIGIYYEHGIRRYLWNDKIYVEYSLPLSRMLPGVTDDVASMLKILEDHGSGPLYHSNGLTCCRAIYELKQTKMAKFTEELRVATGGL